MNKLLRNIISIIGIILLGVVLVLNLFYTSYLSSKEIITIEVNTLAYLAGTVIIAFTIYNICKILNFKCAKIKGKYVILGIIIIIYVVLQILWVNCRNACPAVDQKTVYQVAVRNDRRNFKRNNRKWYNIWSKTTKLYIYGML